MADEITTAAPKSPASTAIGESKRDKIAAVWAKWRNDHINNIDVHAFRTVEAASKHLIDALADL